MVDQAQDEINKLRAENEKLRLQLSACGAAAMANTVDSAERMRCISPDLKSGSWEAVCEAVNREMYYRDHRATLLEANLVVYPALHTNIKQLKEQRDPELYSEEDEKRMDVVGGMIGLMRVLRHRTKKMAKVKGK